MSARSVWSARSARSARRRAAGGLTAMLLGSALLATPAPPARAAGYDLDKGQYLTPEEYKKLSKDEAQAYCQKLAQEIDIENDNAAAANSMMADIDAEITSLRAQLAEAKSANEPLASTVAELEAKLKELQELPRSYTVVPGDFLMKISEKTRIYSDPHQWGRIWRANRDKIKNPNLIYPGQILLIPRGETTSHVVVEGETLRRIASYPEIYSDSGQWKKIFDANHDKIANPDVLPVGVELAIPR
jgi:nucleoid-associated protein YgaU